jgi:hypothetical protein
MLGMTLQGVGYEVKAATRFDKLFFGLAVSLFKQAVG